MLRLRRRPGRCLDRKGRAVMHCGCTPNMLDLTCPIHKDEAAARTPPSVRSTRGTARLLRTERRRAETRRGLFSPARSRLLSSGATPVPPDGRSVPQVARARLELASRAYEARKEPSPPPRGEAPGQIRTGDAELRRLCVFRLRGRSPYGRIRTSDPALMRRLLCRLSYAGEALWLANLARRLSRDLRHTVPPSGTAPRIRTLPFGVGARARPEPECDVKLGCLTGIEPASCRITTGSLTVELQTP
jgi:hypothetical protein